MATAKKAAAPAAPKKAAPAKKAPAKPTISVANVPISKHLLRKVVDVASKTGRTLARSCLRRLNLPRSFAG